MKPRIKCGGAYSQSTPDGGPELYCEHEPPFDCGDCIINGGKMSPISHKPFRGNSELYSCVPAFLKQD
jgi:hypothetical protein